MSRLIRSYEIRLSGLVEAVCIHGVGHPVVSSASQSATAGSDFKSLMTHTCDGCCLHAEWTELTHEELATVLYTQQQQGEVIPMPDSERSADSILDNEDYARVARSLTNITPSAETIANIETLRGQAKGLASAITTLVPRGRERSLAYTKLEELLMWAVKGMCLGDGTPTGDPHYKEFPADGILRSEEDA